MNLALVPLVCARALELALPRSCQHRAPVAISGVAKRRSVRGAAPPSMHDLASSVFSLLARRHLRAPLSAARY